MVTILYEDEFILAANKPPGIPSDKTIDSSRVNFFSLVSSFILERDHEVKHLSLHHRIDLGTSGALLFSKNNMINSALSEMFRARKIEKTYLALAGPQKGPDHWEVANYLSPKKDSKTKKVKMRSVTSGGSLAQTSFKIIKRLNQGVFIEAKPKTGRMHQIRVHLADGGSGIFGDDLYTSPKSPQAQRLMLHAHKLHFSHPATQQQVTIESPIPKDFLEFLDILA